jgi:hypothetical protein
MSIVCSRQCAFLSWRVGGCSRKWGTRRLLVLGLTAVSHTSAYVSIRQHTSAYVSMRYERFVEAPSRTPHAERQCGREAASPRQDADIACSRMLTYADVC